MAAEPATSGSMRTTESTVTTPGPGPPASPPRPGSRRKLIMPVPPTSWKPTPANEATSPTISR